MPRSDEMARLRLRTFALAFLRCRGRIPKVGQGCPSKENKTLQNTDEPQTQRSAKPQKKLIACEPRFPDFPIWRIPISPAHFSVLEHRFTPKRHLLFYLLVKDCEQIVVWFYFGGCFVEAQIKSFVSLACREQQCIKKLAGEAIKGLEDLERNQELKRS